ncbi:MAG: hypothetical protein M0Q13_10920 [Methanothrix sp.]|jgi:hypothetical protein|nr:hypothetical protein [Methanothrix sp.]
MSDMLKAIDIITVLTNLDAKYVTLFLISISKAFNVAPGPRYEREMSEIYDFYLNAPVSREEFIQAFMNSKGLVISGEVDQPTYRMLLRESLVKGIEPRDTFNFIREKFKNI